MTVSTQCANATGRDQRLAHQLSASTQTCPYHASDLLEKGCYSLLFADTAPVLQTQPSELMIYSPRLSLYLAYSAHEAIACLAIMPNSIRDLTTGFDVNYKMSVFLERISKATLESPGHIDIVDGRPLQANLCDTAIRGGAPVVRPVPQNKSDQDNQPVESQDCLPQAQ